MSGIEVRIPARGGGDDPCRPSRHKPGRAHQKEAFVSSASKAFEAYMRSLKVRRRLRGEHEARSAGLPIKQEVEEEEEGEDDDVVITSSRTCEC